MLKKDIPELQKEIMVGCDPEFFLYDTKLKQYVSAHEIVPGTKRDPFKIPGGAVQCDGTAVEFNIDPARTREEFANNINRVLTHIRKKIPKYLEFKFLPSIAYQMPYWEKLPDYCKESGCDPDYICGYIREPKKIEYGQVIGGGHIHMSWGVQAPVSLKHFNDCVGIVGLASYNFRYILNMDKDSYRKYITSMNIHRPKPYGVEYRSPSNMWLNTPDMWPKIFDIAKNTVLQHFGGHRG